MKNLLLFILLFLGTFQLLAQSFLINETKLAIEMPNEDWKLADTQTNGDKKVYYFKRTPITDSQNRQVIPNISIIVESNQGMDVVTYSAMKRIEMPFEVLEVFIPANINMEYENAIGYKGVYDDKFGAHKIYVIFLNNKKKGLRIICDVTEELFDQVEPEFLDALTSINEMKKNKKRQKKGK